jgi:long-chain acyl-CoA synthetase
MLRESALAYPEKPVALYDGGAFSYAQLDALSDRFAAGLRASGVGRGDTVGLQLPNIPQFLIA